MWVFLLKKISISYTKIGVFIMHFWELCLMKNTLFLKKKWRKNPLFHCVFCDFSRFLRNRKKFTSTKFLGIFMGGPCKYMGRSWADHGRSWADHGQIMGDAGFWWVFAAYGWVLVGFRSLRLGFQISMLGFSTLRLGFQISMLGFTTLRLPFGKKNCFFRLGFLNKNQLGRAGSSFLRKRYINTIPSLL